MDKKPRNPKVQSLLHGAAVWMPAQISPQALALERDLLPVHELMPRSPQHLVR